MKSKAPLVLMEQLIMILVFALAAAVCVRTFVYTNQLSEQSGEQDRAVLAAQSVAETLKECSGDYERAAECLGAFWDGDTMQMNGVHNFCVKITPEKSAVPLMEKVQIEILDSQGTKVLFVIPVAWQEVNPDA